MKWVVENLYGVVETFYSLESARSFAKKRAEETGYDHYVYECAMRETFGGRP